MALLFVARYIYLDTKSLLLVARYICVLVASYALLSINMKPTSTSRDRVYK